MRRRIVCLDKLSDSEKRTRDLINARTFLGLYLSQLNHWAEAWDAVEPVAQLARDGGYRKRLGQIQSVKGCYYGFVEEDNQKAFEALDESLRIAQDENDFITLILSGMWEGVIHSYDCNYEKALSSFQMGVDICIMAESNWGIAAQKAQQAYFSYFPPGRTKILTERSIEALEIAEDSGDPLSRGISYTAYGWACYLKGDITRAEKYARKGGDLCERIGFIGWEAIAHECLGNIYFGIKDYEKYTECWLKVIRSHNEARINPSIPLRLKLALALGAVMLGDRDIELEPLRIIAKKEKIKLYQGWSYRCMAEILLNLGGEHFSESVKWIQKAIEADTKNGMNYRLGINYALYGDYFRRKGDSIKAQGEFGKAIEILQECGADGWVEKYQKELAEL